MTVGLMEHCTEEMPRELGWEGHPGLAEVE